MYQLLHVRIISCFSLYLVAHHYSPYLIVGCTHLYWDSSKLETQLTELHHFQYVCVYGDVE